jgi:hypothetical protein
MQATSRHGTSLLLEARRPGHVVIWTAGDSDAMRSGCRFLAPENPDLSQSPDLSLSAFSFYLAHAVAAARARA